MGHPGFFLPGVTGRTSGDVAPGFAARPRIVVYFSSWFVLLSMWGAIAGGVTAAGTG